MWRNHSLIYPVILCLLLAISATLAVGYGINFAILEDVLRERMERQARQIGSDVLHTLESRVHRLERFKNSWLENALWTLDARDDARLVDKQVEDTPEVVWKQMQAFFPLWGVDFILLLDQADRVIQRMPVEWGREHPMPSGLFNQVRARLVQNQPAWHLDQVAGHWQILFFVPVKMDAQEGFHLLIFGQELGKVVAKLQREDPRHPFLIADSQGVVAGSGDFLSRAQWQPAVAAATIRENSPRMVFDSTLSTNLYYTPIAFLDQTFSLVVPVALDEVRQVLANSRQRLVVSFLLIIVFLVGLGIVMERVLLRPLRRLRVKAATMVSACSRQEQVIHLNPDEQGNELVLLEKALEEASIKLYAHVAHLVDTKYLLEGFALKDPITTLGNRRMLDEFLDLTLGSCKRRQRQVAVMLIVPDLPEAELSGAAPDVYNQVLRELADRLRKQMRGEDLAFRVQQNEFVAFAPECGDEEQILAMAYRLHKALIQPYRLSGERVIALGIHMGIAVFPGAGEHGEVLLANARVALEDAYKAGRRPFVVFNYPSATDDGESIS